MGQALSEIKQTPLAFTSHGLKYDGWRSKGGFELNPITFGRQSKYGGSQ